MHFDEVAETYARVRPGYPEAAFDDLWSQASLGTPNVLEIGCGTGQATMPLLRRGARVVALELGPRLAEIARKTVAATIITANFDTWEVPDSAFDLVLAATSFHWLDPQTRCARVARCLGENGWLAVLANVHVSDESGDDFFERTQDAYAEAYGAAARGRGLPSASSVDPATIDEQLFEHRAHHQYRWTEVFDAKRYVETLATYSDVGALREDRRERLFGRIRDVIQDEFGGRIQKHWSTSLTLARRRPGS